MSKLEWVVKKCTLDELQNVMNGIEHDGYTIDKYEKFAEEYDGIKFMVIASRKIR